MSGIDVTGDTPLPRRVVIGQDSTGKSAVIFDSTSAPLLSHKYPGVATTMLWKEGETMDVASRDDQLDVFQDVPVPVGGTRFFMNRIEPGVRTEVHTTTTVEYHYVVSGRIIALLEGEDVELKAGDTIVMRGTPHGWYNPSDTEPWIDFATMVDMSSSFE
jgi:quercetin dioxygenase-like cupin family protein